MLLPGITISPTDFVPVEQIQMVRFDDGRWRLFGILVTGAVNA
jgi:branched-chain amino acid transport system substrate-binding protein